MEKLKVVVLDFTDCKHWLDFHERIRVAFDYPEWYGKNWDAFWDLLREPWTNGLVQVSGLHTLPKELQESGKMVLSLLEKNKQLQVQWGAKFRYEMIS